jgi:plastocyanin
VRRTLLNVALALLVCSAGTTAAQKPAKPAAAQKPAKPATHTVTIDATSFKPATLTVKPGDTVLWVNKDIIPHTATSKKAAVFDSSTLAPGKSWKHTFKGKGEFQYLCQFHPTMKGSIVVK